MKSSSRYLYNKKERDLYLQYLGSFSENQCFFSRHIPVYIENKDSNSMGFYENHLLTCESCQKEVRKAENVITLIAERIPYAEVDEYISSHLRSQLREVDELLTAVDQEKSERLVSKRKKLALQVVLDLSIGVITNRGFYKGIILAFFAYVLLRIFL